MPLNLLVRRYLQIVMPGLFLLLVAQLAQTRYQWTLDSPIKGPVLNAAILSVTAFLAIIGPVLYRLYFAGRQRSRPFTSAKEFAAYQLRAMALALSALYMAPLVIIFPVANVTRYAVLLLALYAAYYYYPSEKKEQFDRKLFRVRDDD